MRSRFLTRFLAAFVAVIAVPPAPTFAASNVSKVTKDSPLMTTPNPVLFRELVAFDTERHSKVRLPSERTNFSYAKKAQLLPLTFAEVGQALHAYPVVMVAEDDKVALVAMTGLSDSGNRFVDTQGEWRPGIYIPAYVRGYPFIAIRPAENAEPILALDPQAADFMRPSGQLLIGADGQHSEQLKGIMAFQAEYRQLAERTAVMTKALKDAGVLEEGSLQLQTPDSKEAQKIGGFLVVSEPKLKALPPDALKKLMEADALGLAYAQLFSMGSLPNLFATQAASPSPEPAKPKARRSSKKAP
jgi:hypothetical protein